VFSPTRDAPWAPGSETGKGQQHPEAVAMRSAEGRNNVDEGTLARTDCEANLARKGEDRFGRQYARIQDGHSELFG
jgi:hypothetical protein